MIEGITNEHRYDSMVGILQQQQQFNEDGELLQIPGSHRHQTS
jgi:hypothetical protein